MQVSGDISLELPPSAAIQMKIDTLTELYGRIQTLRQIPRGLLHTPARVTNPANSAPNSSSIISSSGNMNMNMSRTSVLGQSDTTSVRAEFAKINVLADYIRNGPGVQEALKVARASELADDSNISSTAVVRREQRKRRRCPSPVSPQPYIDDQRNRKSCSLFPISAHDPAPLCIDDLTEYIKSFNRSQATKLHIWTRTKKDLASLKKSGGDPRALGSPLIVRFTSSDVLTAYISMSYDADAEEKRLYIENVTAFSSREEKSPHSQSDYNIFQLLSQQMATMLQSHPMVSFQTFSILLSTYENMFVEICQSCGRVLDIDTHMPAVARLWIDAEKEGESGKWEPRHPACR